MTPSPPCAECGGLGWDVHETRIVKCVKCRRFSTTWGAIAHVIKLARSSAALLEAGEMALGELGFLARHSGLPPNLGIVTNLQTAIARAKEGEL